MVADTHRPTSPKRILFLLLPGFDEAAVTDCVGRLHAAGSAVSVVGVSRRTVRGRRGIPFQPDLSLGDITATDDVAALVLLSDRRLAGGQFTDPRIGRLAAAVQRGRGAVLATPAAALALGRDPALQVAGATGQSAVLTILPANGLDHLPERLHRLAQ